MTPDSLSFTLYLLAVAGIAIYGWRATRNISDYVLGGRTLSPFTAAVSAGASDMSSWILLPLPALAYNHSTEAGLIALGLLGGHYFTALIIAPRLRRYSEMLNDSQTIPQFLCNRTGRSEAMSGTPLRVICALTLLVFMLLYVASGLVAGGKLFSQLFDVNASTAVLLGAAVICAYTLLGGFLAISWTDVLQGVLMLIILVALPIVIALSGGTPESNSIAAVAQQTSTEQTIGWVLVISSLAWGLGYSGMPHILARYKAVRSPDAIPQFRRWLTGWIALALLGALSIGLLAKSWYVNPAGVGEDFTLNMLDMFFSPWLAGLALAAIMAAVMSTADSQLLVASTSISEDLIAPLMPRITAAQRLWLSRCVVLGIALIAIGIALQGNNTILSLVSYAWAGLGAAFGPVLLLALFWDRFSYLSAIAGILTGGISAVVLHHFPLLGLYELLPAFALGLLATWAVGILTPDPRAAEQFAQLKNPA